MTRRTRLFLVGSGGILVLGLGTGVVASYMGLQGVIIGGDGPSELAYVPPDARAVAFANVREVMGSELRTKLIGIRPDRPAEPLDFPVQDRDSHNGFFEATGLDLEQDVDSVVASLTGSSGGENEHPLLLARGRFNTGLIEAAIVEHAEGRSRIETYKGTRMVIMPGGPDDKTDGSQALAVAFAEPGLLVLGTEAAVRRGLDAKLSGNNVIDNVELMKLVRDSDDGNTWVVARFDALTGRAQLPEEIASRLPAISWLAASGHINGGLRAVVRAETRDDAAAQNLREVIRGLMALAQLQVGQADQFTELLNSLELGGTGKTVSLGFAVDPAVIEALGALAVPRGPQPPARTPPTLPTAPPAL